MKGRQIFTLFSILVLVSIGIIYAIWKPIIWSLIVVIPLVLIGVRDMLQSKHSIRKIKARENLISLVGKSTAQYFLKHIIQGLESMKRHMILCILTTYFQRG